MPGQTRISVATLVLLTGLADLWICGALAAATISACVLDGEGFSLSDLTVNVYDQSGTLVGNGITSRNGCVDVETGSSPGPFFARTQTSRAYPDELYASHPCAGSCDVTRGEPISPSSAVVFQLAYNTLRYNNGPVIHSPNIYYIFYGDWSGYGTASAILEDFGSHLGGSAYFGSNTSFFDTLGPHNQELPVFNSPTLKRAIFDSSYSQGKVLNPDSVANIIGSALSAGSLPADTSGVYFVLSSPDVNGLDRNGNAFCTRMCAWHDYLSGGGHTFAAAWIGHPYHCTASGFYDCGGGPGNTLNGDAGADAMVSVIAHELNESVTDPVVGSGWYSPAPGETGNTEVGDRCLSFSGITYPAQATGLPANVHFGSRDYLIQGKLVHDPSGDYCATGNESIRSALEASGKPTPLSERCGAVTAMATYNGGLLVAFDDHLCGADRYSVEWFPDPLGEGVTIKSGMCSPVTAMTAYDGGVLVAFAKVGCTVNYSRIVWLAHPDRTFDGGTDVRGTSCAGVTAMEVYNPAQAGPGGLLVALDNSAPCASGGQSVEWYQNPLSANGATVVNAGGCSPLTALAGHDGGVLAAFNSVGCQSGQNGIQFLPRPDQSLSGTPVSVLDLPRFGGQ